VSAATGPARTVPFARLNGPAGQRPESWTGGKIGRFTDGAALKRRHADYDRQAAAPAVRHRGGSMSLSQRKPLAALAAGTAALALALPVASASAATTPPAPVFPTISSLFMPGSLPCRLLDGELRVANQFGITVWTDVVNNVFAFTGCGGATP
jgi:hypothetical protein